MLVTVTGSSNLSDSNARFLFGIVSHLLEKHAVRGLISNGDADTAVKSAIERHILNHNDYDIELYPISSDNGSFILRDLIVKSKTNWGAGLNRALLKDYVRRNFFNEYKVGALVNSIKGPKLDESSSVVVYASGPGDDLEYSVVKQAAREAGSDFYDITISSQLAGLFKRLEGSEDALRDRH